MSFARFHFLELSSVFNLKKWIGGKKTAHNDECVVCCYKPFWGARETINGVSKLFIIAAESISS